MLPFPAKFKGKFVDVELYMIVDHLLIQFLCVATDIFCGSIWIFKSHPDTLPDSFVQLPEQVITKRSAGNDTTKRDRTTAALLPPFAKVLERDEALLLISKATLMDYYSCIDLVPGQGSHDLIEPHRYQICASWLIHT